MKPVKIYLLYLALPFTLLSASSFIVNAELTIIQKNNLRPDKVSSAKIVYDGTVTPGKVLELMGALEKLNNNYPHLKKIMLYLNSYGGDMNAGHMAFEAVSSSPTPVTTVNLSMVASSATLLYCAGSERLVMPSSSFLLHPASVRNANLEYLQPDNLHSLKQASETMNELFKMVYKKCSDLSDEELNPLLYSESTRKLLTAGEAITRKMAGGITDRIQQSDISLYIGDATR